MACSRDRADFALPHTFKMWCFGKIILELNFLPSQLCLQIRINGTKGILQLLVAPSLPVGQCLEPNPLVPLIAATVEQQTEGGFCTPRVTDGSPPCTPRGELGEIGRGGRGEFRSWPYLGKERKLWREEGLLGIGFKRSPKKHSGRSLIIRFFWCHSPFHTEPSG